MLSLVYEMHITSVVTELINRHSAIKICHAITAQREGFLASINNTTTLQHKMLLNMGTQSRALFSMFSFSLEIFV